MATQALERLYAGLPRLACKGECQDSCRLTSDLLGVVERRVIEAARGSLAFFDEQQQPPGFDLDPSCVACPLLDDHGLCSVHGIRPLLCRLWGIVDDPLMICPHGCRPEPRYLSNREVRNLWARMAEIDRRYAEEVDNSHGGIHEP